MPPSGYASKAVVGSLIFIRSCYEELLEEVKSGKFKTYEEAIEHELSQIKKALLNVEINEAGKLVN